MGPCGQITRYFRRTWPGVLLWQVHVTKPILSYPTPLEQDVRGIKTVEEKRDHVSGIVYRKRIAVCNNVLPSILRKLTVMDVDDVFLEEESWLDLKQKTMNIKSRCLTWTQFATLQEVSVFKESPANPNWTEFFQKGSVTVTGVGRLNRLFELFAQSFFSKGVQKSVQVMETILEQKFGHPCS
ncbi:PRELI domain-containing protein 2 isoform X1 [Paramormyrops kingsleyae]|uniref:PRELI domain-containing protein 2 isoform X1 n=1 Tax=Paramormyrops kingsleyae TaxID=1676925 RepID=UPI000CD5F046|nr:PRELI domain-containing protein 2 isoform X1 [Paramormyrops kingsleyae]